MDSKRWITKCCGHLFTGENHSPWHKGKCRNCNKLWNGQIPVNSESERRRLESQLKENK